MVTHSSTLAWEIPWTEEPGGLQSMMLSESDTKPPPPTPFECKLQAAVGLTLPSTPELFTTTVLSLGPRYLCSQLLLFIASVYTKYSCLGRQECWSGLPFPSPRDLPHPGVELMSPAGQADSLPLFHLNYCGFYYIYIKEYIYSLAS